MEFSYTRIQAFIPTAKKVIRQALLLPLWIKLSLTAALLLMGYCTSVFWLLEKYHRVNQCAEEVALLCLRREALEKQKMLHKKMEAQISRGAKDYIKQSLESISCLQGEHLRVAALAKQFPDNPFLKERLLFLSSDQNQIHFEQKREGSEVHLHLSHRVQMDLNDLKTFLEAVEGDRYDDRENKPFLVMKKFDLMKCYEKGDEKVYSIHAEIIQK